MQSKQKLNALIYGATGAVGRQLVKVMLKSERWAKVTVVVRKQLQEWSTLENKTKLQIQNVADMDTFQDTKLWKYQNIHSVFCCLGSRTGQGQQMFTKIDKTYPLWISEIAKFNKIRHYSLVSSVGGDSSSWFLYPRIKGQVEEALKLKGLQVLSIYKPGVLKNRYDPRFGQGFAAILPFVPKIDVKQCAIVMMKHAQKVADDISIKGSATYENSDMLNMISL